MDWREKYADKIVSAQEAVSHVRSGDTIHSTMFSSLPYALFDELGAQKNRLENVNIYLGFGGGLYRPLAKACNGHVNVNSLFLGPAERMFMYKMGSRVNVQVLQLSRTYDDRSRVHPGDVIMMAATPPDENGMMSFGLTPMDTALCEAARDVILQVNENVPFVRGVDNMINIKDVTCVIDKTQELCVMPPSEPSELDNKIADIIAERIPDGACIQFGIGGLGIPFSTFMMKGYIESIPRDYDEAVYMDGGSVFTVFFKVICPLASPAIASVSIFNFLTAWEEFPWAMTVINDNAKRTLPIAISGFFGQHQFTQWGYVFAMSVASLVPVLIVFICCQKYFVSGLQAGGIKG